MEDLGTRPWKQHYTVNETEIVAEVPDLRVLVITLGPGEIIPWHWHTTVTDTFFCLEGTLEVEARVPRERHVLAPGERCAVGPKRTHIVRNIGAGTCRYLIVQGIGRYDYQPTGAPA